MRSKATLLTGMIFVFLACKFNIIDSAQFVSLVLVFFLLYPVFFRKNARLKNVRHVKSGMKLRSIPVLILLFLWTMVSSSHAMNPMRTVIHTALPEKIETVGEAAQYYADVAGYKLVTTPPTPSESKGISDEKLNTLSFTDQLLPIDEAILYLLKEEYRLIIDHDHKLFSFEMYREPQKEMESE